MLKSVGLITLVILISFSTHAQTSHTINISGLSFSPNDLTIEVGDTVVFNGSASHPVLEVSEDTWNANGSTALSGGFAFPSGVGEIIFDEAGTHFYICENHIGSGMKGKITVSTSTSASLNKINFTDVSIFPNPLTTNYLTIEIPNNSVQLELNIYDLTGRVKVYKKIAATEDRIQIDGSYLSPGAYIIQLHSEKGTHTSKFIKN